MGAARKFGEGEKGRKLLEKGRKLLEKGRKLLEKGRKGGNCWRREEREKAAGEGRGERVLEKGEREKGC
jgi:hypothetical protein